MTKDITPEILLRAYASGVFPMAHSADDPDLFWVEPERRGIFPLDAVHVSRSLAKVVRQEQFSVIADGDFEGVIAACAEFAPDRPSTWISGRIRALYTALFRMGHAHCIACYRDGRMVGGLYGVKIGAAFFGESMFRRATDASKTAFVHLAARLRLGGFQLLDAQFVTDHLTTLGAEEISRAAYRQKLARAIAAESDFSLGGRLSLTGKDALEALRQKG